MKLQHKLTAWLLCFAMLFALLPVEAVSAEVFTYTDDYTGTNYVFDTNNPVDFYNKLDKELNSKALFANGNIYFATKAKTAASYTTTRYRSVGYTVKVTDGTNTMSIQVKKNGKYLSELCQDCKHTDGYTYGLLGISYNDIVKLCTNKNSATAARLFASNTIAITMDAIMVKVVDNVPKGGIGTSSSDTGGEDGSGNITTWGTVYHLDNASELAALRETFKKTDFSSYQNIYSKVSNNPLKIQYFETPASSMPRGEETVKQFQSATLKAVSDYFAKTGYHTDASSAWRNMDTNKTLAESVALSADEISNAVRFGSSTVRLTPNWVPNTYHVVYLSNNDTGKSVTQTYTYDEYFSVKDNQAYNFTNPGHTFAGWKLCGDMLGQAPINTTSIGRLSGYESLPFCKKKFL